MKHPSQVQYQLLGRGTGRRGLTAGYLHLFGENLGRRRPPRAGRLHPENAPLGYPLAPLGRQIRQLARQRHPQQPVDSFRARPVTLGADLPENLVGRIPRLSRIV